MSVTVGPKQVDRGVEDPQRLPLGAAASRVIARDAINGPVPVVRLVEAGSVKDSSLLLGGLGLEDGPPSFEQLVGEEDHTAYYQQAEEADGAVE